MHETQFIVLRLSITTGSQLPSGQFHFYFFSPLMIIHLSHILEFLFVYFSVRQEKAANYIKYCFKKKQTTIFCHHLFWAWSLLKALLQTLQHLLKFGNSFLLTYALPCYGTPSPLFQNTWYVCSWLRGLAAQSDSSLVWWLNRSNEYTMLASLVIFLIKSVEHILDSYTLY